MTVPRAGWSACWSDAGRRFLVLPIMEVWRILKVWPWTQAAVPAAFLSGKRQGSGVLLLKHRPGPEDADGKEPVMGVIAWLIFGLVAGLIANLRSCRRTARR